MTPDEADRIVAELNVIFPAKKLVVEEVLRWEENLSIYAFESAQIAVKSVEQNLKFWPSWAEFRQIIDPVEKRHRISVQQLAIESPQDKPCSREENLEHIKEIRRIIEANKRNIK